MLLSVPASPQGAHCHCHRPQDAEHKIVCTIPIFEPVSSQYFVRLVALDWLYAEAQAELNLRDIVLPIAAGSHTDLLDLAPLPRVALKNADFEGLYAQKFSHFNPIQTQAFHTLYHTDESVLLGAPTGAKPQIEPKSNPNRIA